MLTFIAPKVARSRPGTPRRREAVILELIPAAGWDRRLELSEREADVVRVVEDYLATLDHCEIALLPPRCRPPKLRHARDVSSYAFDLATYCSDDDEGVGELVHRLAHLLARACLRLSQIA